MSGIRTNAITEKQNHKYKPLQRQQPLHHMYLLKVPPAWLYICPDATVGFPQLHLEICPDTRQGVLPFQSNFCPDPWLTLPYIIRGPTKFDFRTQCPVTTSGKCLRSLFT